MIPLFDPTTIKINGPFEVTKETRIFVVQKKLFSTFLIMTNQSKC